MMKIRLAVISVLVGCSTQQSPAVQQVSQEAAKPSAPAEGKAAPPPTEGATPEAAKRMAMAEPKAKSSRGEPGEKAEYALYLLALSWTPNFCADPQHKSKQQCKELKEDSFAATHLAIHGLWPNYDDQQAEGKPEPWPSFCPPYAACSIKTPDPNSCDPDPSSIPDDMKKYGPGYIADDYFLADHEWPKHGSCTGLGAGKFFQEAIDMLKSLPGDDGTPKVLSDSIGKKIKATALQAAFGDADSVVLSCDSSCNLSQVGICLASGNDGIPHGRTACPQNVRKSSYDNECLLNKKCSTITIQKVNSSTEPPAHKCSASRGQGPACSADDFCKENGFKRCAKSGCCTNVKK